MSVVLQIFSINPKYTCMSMCSSLKIEHYIIIKD
jgi:hypothetical protein